MRVSGAVVTPPDGSMMVPCTAHRVSSLLTFLPRLDVSYGSKRGLSVAVHLCGLSLTEPLLGFSGTLLGLTGPQAPSWASLYTCAARGHFIPWG